MVCIWIFWRYRCLTVLASRKPFAILMLLYESVAYTVPLRHLCRNHSLAVLTQTASLHVPNVPIRLDLSVDPKSTANNNQTQMSHVLAMLLVYATSSWSTKYKRFQHFTSSTSVSCDLASVHVHISSVHFEDPHCFDL